MPALVLPLAGVVLSIAGCGRAAAPATSAQGGSGAAGDDVRTIVVKLGVLHPGEAAQQTLSVENDTSTDWTVKDITTACSCAVGKSHARKIAAGAAGEFSVHYRAAGTTRQDQRVIRLEFVEPEAPVVEFQLQCFVQEVMYVYPNQLTIEAAPSATLVRELEVLNFAEAPWESVTASCSEPWVQISLARKPDASSAAPEVPDSAPIEVWLATVTMDTSGMTATGEDLRLNLQFAAANAQKSCPVRVSIRGPVAAIPQRLFFGRIGRDAPTEREITLRFLENGIDPADVRVRPSENLAGQLTAEVVADDSAGQSGSARSKYIKVKARLLPEAVGLLKGSVNIEFDVPGLPPVSVPVLASVK